MPCHVKVSYRVTIYPTSTILSTRENKIWKFMSIISCKDVGSSCDGPLVGEQMSIAALSLLQINLNFMDICSAAGYSEVYLPKQPSFYPGLER